MSEHRTTKDQLSELKRYHAEIVESDGAECEAMQLTRWAIDEIERLRTAMTGISTCSTCEACRGAALRALRGEAFEIMRQLEAENMETMQSCQPDWCPTCTKPYAECRCNGVAR